MARYVQVWFHCDVIGCECRTEILMEVVPTWISTSGFGGAKHPILELVEPPGWTKFSIQNHLEQVVLCPEHVWIVEADERLHLFEDRHLTHYGIQQKRQILARLQKPVSPIE